MANGKNHPDAVMIPDDWKSGNNALERAASLVDHAERILGVDRSKGERGWVRHHSGGPRFCTKDPQDTILFSTGHPQEGRQRYRWVSQPDGSVHGYLVEVGPPETEHVVE